MNKLLFVFVLVISASLMAGTLVTLTDTDQRYATKTEYDYYSGPYTTIDGAVGMQIVDGVNVWFRSAVTFNPSATEDYAFVTSANVKTTTDTNPVNSYYLLAMLMSYQPSTLSASGLWNDTGNGTEFGRRVVPTSGLGANEVMTLNEDFYPHLEGQFSQNWAAVGMVQEDDEDETNETYTEFDFGVLKFVKEIRMSTAGQLSQDERWGGSHTLSGNITVPAPLELKLYSGLSLTLSGYYVKSTGGTIIEQSSVSVSPKIVVKDGSTVKGYYPSVSSALSNASSGQTVRVYSSQTLSGNLTVPSGVTLSLESGSTLTLNGYKATTSSGSIAMNGGSVSPNIQLKTSADVRKGLYPTIASAIGDAAANDKLYLGAATFTENVDMPSNLQLIGSTRSSTILNGDVSFWAVSSSKITNMTVNGEIVVDGNSSSIAIHYLYAKDKIDIDLGSGHDIWQVTTQNSGYIELYCTSPLVDDNISENGLNVGITTYGSDFSADYGSYADKSSAAVFCTNSSDPQLVNLEFCSNDVDIYAASGCTVDATDVAWFSECPAPVAGSGTINLPGSCSACPGGLLKRNADSVGPVQSGNSLAAVAGDDEAAKLYFEALNLYRSINNKIREDRKNDAERRPEKYAADYGTVATKMKTVLDNYPQSPYAVKALRYIDYSHRSLNRADETTVILNNAQKSASSPAMMLEAERLLAADLQRQKKYAEAIAVLDELLKADDSVETVQPLLYRKGVIYQKYLKDNDRAAAFYSQVINLDPKSVVAWTAQRRLDKMGKNYRPGAAQEELSMEKLEFDAFNSPNPANPGTTIKYTLPEDGRVVVAVFNVVGRRVTELKNTFMPKGSHIVYWNGTDQSGSPAATGLYFYRIQFNDKVLTNKFLLVK